MEDRHDRTLKRLGLQVTGAYTLATLVCTRLDDDQVVTAMRRLASGQDAGVDLAAHAISEAEWKRRRAAQGRALRPLSEVDAERRRRRKARKRRQRCR